MLPRSFKLSRRLLSTVHSNSFKAENTRITLCPPEKRKVIPIDPNQHKFGSIFSDHLLSIRWTQEKGWNDPEIMPFQNFSLHPATKTLHYAQNIFEGMKGFRSADGKVLLFRPEMNMNRMVTSAERASLATFDPIELLKCLKQLLTIDADWVPRQPETSLYIRPFYMGTEPALGVNPSSEAHLYIIISPVGGYFGSKLVPVSLLADPQWIRAWPGGAGCFKLASNYGPTLAIQKMAEKKGCHQVLWLFGDDHQLTEAGAMNIFVYLINEAGEKELVTPPLLEQGIILPGITRDSILTVARDWNEFKVTERPITMKEVTKALEQGRLLEMFGAGTAAVVSPIGRIHYKDKDVLIPFKESDSLALRIRKMITDIQYNRIEYKNWTQIVC